MEIVLINQHANNFGDEAAAIALIEELVDSYKDVHITIHYLGKGTIRYANKAIENFEYRLRDFGIIKIGKRIIKNFVGIKKETDERLIKFGDTIYCADYIFVSPSGADLGHYNGWSALVEIALVMSYGKNVIFHLNSIDKSPQWLFERLKRIVLKKSTIYVREKKSKEYLNNIGIHSEFGIDTAFLLKKMTVPKQRCIAFIYSEYDFCFTVEQKKKIKEDIKLFVIKPMITFLKENDYKVKLVPHMSTEKELEYLRLLKDIFDQEAEGICLIEEKVSNALEYQRSIAEATVVISMRYHGLVMAANNSIPFISLSYDSKMDEVSEYCGNAKYNHSLFDLSSFKFKEEIEEIIINQDRISLNLKRHVDLLRETATAPVSDNIFGE